MNHRLYKYRENMIILGLFGGILLLVFFFKPDLELWLRYIILASSILLMAVGLIYLILIIKSEYEERNDLVNYVKVKNVKARYIQIHTARHFGEVVGYKFYADGKSYIYMSSKDKKLEDHISKIYGFEYYKTFRMIKKIKYN